MSFSDKDAMFLLEIGVEELESYVNCKQFHIRSQFGDVFSLILKQPNCKPVNLNERKSKKMNKQQKKAGVRSTSPVKIVPEQNTEPCEVQSIIFPSRISSLITNMQQFPVELSLWSKDQIEERLGSTHIPWSPMYIEYLNKISMQKNPAPVVVSEGYDVYDEYASKRMATIRLNMKLTFLNNEFTSRPEDNQETVLFPGINPTPASIMSVIKSKPHTINIDVGTVKTIYGCGKQKRSRTKRKTSKYVTSKEKLLAVDVIKEYNPKTEPVNKNEPSKDLISREKKSNTPISIASSTRSCTELGRSQPITPVNNTRSCLSIKEAQHNILNYIIGDTQRPNNRVYCVGYFTVEKDRCTSSYNASIQDPNKPKFKVKLCDTSQCAHINNADGVCNESICSTDLPADAADIIDVRKCQNVRCDHKIHPEMGQKPDERILLETTNLNKDCACNLQTVEEVTGGVKANMKFGENQCFCECSCSFGFVKRTTYCGICGGYEKPGEDFPAKPPHETPYPCPIFHKLGKKTKSPIEIKKKKPDCDKFKKNKDDRFKFNYGYAAPQIGHSQCAMPCTGTFGNVPRKMGWLWTADNVPGLKFRPGWQPGAISKQVVHLLRIAKNPEITSSKKRRKEVIKKPTKRPLLIVHKKDGEFKITMETMKNYQKQRVLNQQPFEERPLVTYTIGRTDEENRERKRKRERVKRRLERDQREFIQNAFRDMCKEICLKTYQQALGILPNAEDPDCTCFPAFPGPEDANMDRSCSCSEDTRSLASDTDDDEWIVEFTPPTATFDPKFRGKKAHMVDNQSQYTYLDYRVKLVDYYGNPVPRYFKGPDGQTKCSDLGGFFGPDKTWLTINIDGFVAPDVRWAPMEFIAPGGERVCCEAGKFQLMNGKWLTVGIDGYVDSRGVWKSYPRPRTNLLPGQKQADGHKGSGRGAGRGAGDKKDKKDNKRLREFKSESTWSCFGDASPKTLSKLGIVGHGHDKKILYSTLKEMIAGGADLRIPQRSKVPMYKLKDGRRPRPPLSPKAIDDMLSDRTKCHHSVPSDKGIVAVDADGNKTYFKMKHYKSDMPKRRLANLVEQGISLSSFHAPCFHSFINAQMKKQQVYAKYAKHEENQTGW